MRFSNNNHWYFFRKNYCFYTECHSQAQFGCNQSPQKRFMEPLKSFYYEELLNFLKHTSYEHVTIFHFNFKILRGNIAVLLLTAWLETFSVKEISFLLPLYSPSLLESKHKRKFEMQMTNVTNSHKCSPLPCSSKSLFRPCMFHNQQLFILLKYLFLHPKNKQRTHNQNVWYQFYWEDLWIGKITLLKRGSTERETRKKKRKQRKTIKKRNQLRNEENLQRKKT